MKWVGNSRKWVKVGRLKLKRLLCHHKYLPNWALTTNKFVGLQLFEPVVRYMSQREMNKHYDAHWELTKGEKCEKCGKTKTRVVSKYGYGLYR